MGICFSQPSMIASRCKEADQYARRKKDKFTDQGLEKVRKDTIQQKKKLHHVDDPDIISKRNLKRNNLENNNKQRTDFKGKSGGSGRGGGGGGFTQDTISEQRNKLKHVKRN